MQIKLRNKDIFEYFRLALATVLLDKSSVIAWADREITNSTIPDHEVIELSLSTQLQYSKLIGLMNTFEGIANPQLSTNMLLALASTKCDSGKLHSPSIIQGISLLQAEPHLQKEVRVQLANLDDKLLKFNQSKISIEELYILLTNFLNNYKEYRPIIQSLESTSD